MDKTALCKACKQVAGYKIEKRKLETLPASEYVVVCSNCGNAVHANYINDELERLQREISREHHPVRQAKMVRYYHRKFERFQKEIGEQVGMIGT